MNTAEAAGEQLDGSALDYQEAGPTVPRMILGAQLRKLRENRGITGEEAAERIRASHSKISRLELGRTGCKSRDIADLLTFYGLTDEAERATLLAVAEQANTPGWWSAYNDITTPWLQSYLGLEQASKVIRGYEVQFVPGLLQTADYARAVIRLGPEDISEESTERLVELRTRRQHILRKSQPPHLWVVIDEAALRRPIGGEAVMRAQLQHLVEISELSHVTIQVIPFRTGGHAAAGGPISVLRLPAIELPDVVYLEQLTSAQFPDRPADIEYYRHTMNRLVTEAETPDDSRVALRNMLTE